MAGETISTIIPVFNGEKHLADAIRSALSQSHPPFEVIVVDDGSSDSSAEVAKGFGSMIRYDAQAHRGAGASRNRGVELAHGNFLAFLDADDLWLEDKLSRQLQIFKADQTLDLVFGYVEQFHSPELGEEEKAKIQGHGEILPGYNVDTLLIKKESFARAGAFDDQWRVGEFIDWYLRAIEAGLKSHTLTEVVSRRRLHGRNMMIRERPAMVDYVRIIKASLDRRRDGREQSGSGSAKT
jgi:glycosyltransferase involved in cell wall biosynthesis